MGIGSRLGKTPIGQGIIKMLGGPTAIKSKEDFSGTSISGSVLSAGTPSWRNLSKLSYLLDCYTENTVVQSIINIKAEAFSNMRFKVKDLKTGEIVPLEEYDKDGGVLRELMQQPNPLQSTYEWLLQRKVNFEVFGNAYTYASNPIGYENKFTYKDINVLNNLPSYGIKPVLTGKWLEATTKDEIIKEYKLEGFRGQNKTLPTNCVFHSNTVNIKMDQNFTEGISDLLALQKPISNIDAAYESRNVLIKKRGALGILTSDKKDDVMGSLPLNETEIAEVQKSFEKYGLLEDQHSFLISPQPLKYQKTVMNVKELMLFEEIESNAIAVANAKGVPELLAKYYIKGGTFKNLDASEKRLYDSTIIPETNDFMIGLNNFLGTREFDIELQGSYDHLNVLQVNKKEESETKKVKQETAKSQFMSGLTTFGQYAVACEVDLEDKQLESKRIWDLDDNQLRAIGVATNTKSDGSK